MRTKNSFLVIITVMLLATVMVSPALAWDEGVDVDRDCTNVYVTADPETIFENKVFGVYLAKWVPETVVGTGTFAWGTLQTSMNGTVTITWRKYTRANLFAPWVATSQTYSESHSWSTNRPGGCQITYCHVAGFGDSPANYVTLTTSIQAVLGHFFNNGTPKAGHELDYLGPCNTPPVCEWNPNIFANDPDCQPPHDFGQYDVPGSDCELWWVTRYFTDFGEVYDSDVVASGAWENPYETEEAHFEEFVIYEPEECLQPKDWDYEVSFEGCVLWEVNFHIPEGGHLVLDEGVSASGAWNNSSALETAEVTGTIYWPDETSEEIYIVVSESRECYRCELTRLYYQWSAVDYDAPDWYWGTGDRNGSCWIKTDGPEDPPDPLRQIDICGVCVHPTFLYEADDYPYQGWVYRDCQGNIIYVDPLWQDEWADPDYDSATYCREESCIVR